MRAVESPLVVELPAAFDEHPGPGAMANHSRFSNPSRSLPFKPSITRFAMDC